MKENIEHLKSNPESTKSRTVDDDYSKLKIEKKILKHELNITILEKLNLIWRLKMMILEKVLVKKIFEFETLKEDHEELHKYNTIMKGELTQCKKQLENLYSSKEKIDDSMLI